MGVEVGALSIVELVSTDLQHAILPRLPCPALGYGGATSPLLVKRILVIVGISLCGHIHISSIQKPFIYPVLVSVSMLLEIPISIYIPNIQWMDIHLGKLVMALHLPVYQGADGAKQPPKRHFSRDIPVVGTILSRTIAKPFRHFKIGTHDVVAKNIDTQRGWVGLIIAFHGMLIVGPSIIWLNHLVPTARIRISISLEILEVEHPVLRPCQIVLILVPLRYLPLGTTGVDVAPNRTPVPVEVCVLSLV